MLTITLSHDDWSLHRKGIVDQARHKQKVKEAIKRNLADIVSEQSIITSDGKRLVRVPIRTLEQYKFRYDPNDRRGVGQGDGDTKVGDVLERYGKAGAPGTGQQAGDQPGVDFYEAEITFDELAGLVFEDLSLPNLEERRVRELESETVRFTDIRRSGPFSNLDKRRTIRENLKRNALQGRRGFGHVEMDDLRYKTWERDTRRESNAVVFAMMDVSGSMGTFEKYVSRAFYYWMVRFLRTQLRQRRDRLRRPSHRGEGSVRRGVLHPRRERRNEGFIGLPARPRSRRAALPAGGLEHLSRSTFPTATTGRATTRRACVSLPNCCRIRTCSATARSGKGATLTRVR